MNFILDDAIAFLGKDSIEDVDFVAVSLLTTTGDNIISWYYPLDSSRCLIGFPFLVKKDSMGRISSIERYNILSDDTFFVMPVSSILLLGNLSESQFESFEILCEKWISALENNREKSEGNQQDTRENEDYEDLSLTEVIHDNKKLH